MAPIKIGLDFDGVVAYNPLRATRAVVSFFKKNVLKKRKLSFFVPKNKVQTWLWIMLHESSLFPSAGKGLLRQMSGNPRYEFYLITGRYDCLGFQVRKWLNKFDMDGVFKEIFVNEEKEQPHLFKSRMIEQLNLDVYVEDNWDIVNFLKDKFGKKIYWVCNLLDRHVHYEKKFPSLKEALEDCLSLEPNEP